MLSKDEIDQKAKDCAFEYDTVWWENRRHARKENAKNGDVVAFYRGHHIYNGVVALWGRNRTAVIFYTTPHDVADEKEHQWIPPIFRVEVNQQYVYNSVKSGKPFGEPEIEPEHPDDVFPILDEPEPLPDVDELRGIREEARRRWNNVFVIGANEL